MDLARSDPSMISLHPVSESLETDPTPPRTPLLPLTRAALPAQNAPTPVREDSAYIRGLILQLVKRSGLPQIEISRRMGKKGDAVYHHLYKVKNPSMLWVVQLALACGGRILVEFPKEPLDE